MKCGGNNSFPGKFIDELSEVFHYRDPPWSNAFPGIDISLAPCAPVLNVVTGNQYCKHSPSPPPVAHCAKCHPGQHPYVGKPAGVGSFCCTLEPSGASCPHPGKICCLTPGTIKKTAYGHDGCEGKPRCGNNPTNKT
eukprot:SAG22_NODE_12160_length_454_cov_0.836620_1_plen_136_part_10